MSTTVMQPSAVRMPRTAAAKRSPHAGSRPVVLAGLILALGLLGFGGWVADRSPGTENALVQAKAMPSLDLSASPWLGRLEVTNLEKKLVAAGYSIKVDGRLDAVTKSALADYLRISATHPLSLALAESLQGTAITGSRNPQAWNSRFGLNRRTRFIERPLTGPGGQLDSSGNIRFGGGLWIRGS